MEQSAFSIRKWLAPCLISAVLAGTTGCSAVALKNQRLDRPPARTGYRFENLGRSEANSDSLFVFLTFSGGGTRAASLAYGVLEKLHDTEILWEGERKRLLDEVDVISAVSGGSLPAACYGLFGDDIFGDYPEHVLYKDIQGGVIKDILAVRNYVKLASPFYGRIDLLADELHREVFHEKTFADLRKRGQRPFVIINATDLSIGWRFEFTQDQFDLLHSDLDTYPIGYAVAASAAFPGLFSPMILRNFEKPADYELPLWAREQVESGDPRDIAYRLAKQAESYAGPGRPYIHLTDGGVSDNLGLTPVIRFLLPSDAHGHPRWAQVPETARKVVVITVNAKKIPRTDWDTRGRQIRFFETLPIAGTTPMTNFSDALIEYLKLLLAKKTQECSIRGPRVEYHFVEVSFEWLRDDEERAYFNDIPTSFSLDGADVDRLREAAGRILEEHPDFQALLEVLQGAGE